MEPIPERFPDILARSPVITTGKPMWLQHWPATAYLCPANKIFPQPELIQTLEMCPVSVNYTVLLTGIALVMPFGILAIVFFSLDHFHTFLCILSTLNPKP